MAKYKLAHYNMDQIREKLRDQTISDFSIGQDVAYIPTHVSSPISDDIEFGRVSDVDIDAGVIRVKYYKDILMVGTDALGKSTRPYDLLQLDI